MMDVRSLAKAVMASIAFVAVLPVYLHYRLWFAVRTRHRAQTFQGHSQLMALFPGVVGNTLRRAFYRLTLTHCAPTSCISFGTTFATHEVTIGNGVYIGPHCNLAHVDIEDDVLLGTGVMITSGKRQHYFRRLDVPIRLQGGEDRRVRIGRDSWIGNGAIVMSSVASQAIVGAGAVVTADVAERNIVSGNPAVVVGVREHRE